MQSGVIDSPRMRRRIVITVSIAAVVLGACDLTLPLLNHSQTGQWPWDLAWYTPFSLSPPVPTNVERAIGVLDLIYPVLQIIGGAAAIFWTISWRWSRWVLASGAAGCLISLRQDLCRCCYRHLRLQIESPLSDKFAISVQFQPWLFLPALPLSVLMRTTRAAAD